MKSNAEIFKKYPELLGECDLDVSRLPAPAPSSGGPGVGRVPAGFPGGSYGSATLGHGSRNPSGRWEFSVELSCEWVPHQGLSLPGVIGLASF